MNILKKIDEHFEEFFLFFFMAIMVVAIAAQVFMRYVMSSSLTWSGELARYSFVWLIYLGVSYGVKKQRHIKVDVLLMLLNTKGKIILNIFANLLFLGFAVIIIIYGTGIVNDLFSYGQTSPGLNILMGFVYLATPIGMGLTVIRLIQQIILQLKTLFGNKEFQVKTEQELILEENLDDTESLKNSNKGEKS